MIQANREILDGNGPISPIGWLGEYGVIRLIQNEEFQAIERDGKSVQEFAEETMKKTQKKLEESMAQVLHTKDGDVIETGLNWQTGPEGVLIRELINALNPAKEVDPNLKITVPFSDTDPRVVSIGLIRRLLRTPQILDANKNPWGLALQSNGLYDSNEVPDDRLGHPKGAPEKLVLIRLIPSDGAAGQ